MNNPISTMPGHELYPAPEGCTGHRLWTLLHARTGAFRQQYMDTFERRNLVQAYVFDKARAWARAYEIVCELRDSGRIVVLLGGEVRKAFDHVLREISTERIGTSEWTAESVDALPPTLIHPVSVVGCTWRQLPHPSGLNRWYSVPANRELAELLMEELYVEYHKQQEKM